MHGFQPKKADKWLERLKHISPQLSLRDIEQQKEELAALLRHSSGERCDGSSKAQMQSHHSVPSMGSCSMSKIAARAVTAEDTPATQEDVEMLKEPTLMNDSNEPPLVDQDVVEMSASDALLLLEKEASDGNTASMVTLGERHLEGGRIARDERRAYLWFEQISEREHPLGTARKADCLLAGLGVPQNVEEGRRILVQAASDDDSGEKASMLMPFVAYEMRR